MGMAPADPESQQAAALFGGLAGGSGGETDRKAPRNENYWDMWKSVFCPNFTPFSFTFLIWIINTGLYGFLLISTGVGGEYKLNPLVFLGPDLR